MSKLTKAEEKKVRDEEMLHEAYLDLWYAAKDYDYLIKDTKTNMASYRKSKRKADKNLLRAEARYKAITGRPPLKPKR